MAGAAIAAAASRGHTFNAKSRRARIDGVGVLRLLLRAEGEEAELWFNTEHLHLFDLESGASLLADGSSPGGNGQAPAAVGEEGGAGAPPSDG